MYDTKHHAKHCVSNKYIYIYIYIYYIIYVHINIYINMIAYQEHGVTPLAALNSTLQRRAHGVRLESVDTICVYVHVRTSCGKKLSAM
jgi:hypothetical protein